MGGCYIDGFYVSLHDLGKLISIFFFILGAYGPLGLGWGPLAGQPRPGQALDWTLEAPKSVLEEPSITFPTFGTRHRSRGSGVKNCASEPTFTRAGGQDDGSYTNSFKLHNFQKISIFTMPSDNCGM